MARTAKRTNPHAGPDELLKEFAKIGLRQVMLQNQRRQWQLQQAMEALAQSEMQASTIASIVGDPLAEERSLMEAKQQHREHMARQRQERSEDPLGMFTPIVVDSHR